MIVVMIILMTVPVTKIEGIDLPKDVDGDPDKDDEDAPDADHRKHPVVHYLPV